MWTQGMHGEVSYDLKQFPTGHAGYNKATISGGYEDVSLHCPRFAEERKNIQRRKWLVTHKTLKTGNQETEIESKKVPLALENLQIFLSFELQRFVPVCFQPQLRPLAEFNLSSGKNSTISRNTHAPLHTGFQRIQHMCQHFNFNEIIKSYCDIPLYSAANNPIHLLLVITLTN